MQIGYAFTVDGDGEQPIGPNATAPVNSLGAGTHSVQLLGVAEHCTLDGANPGVSWYPAAVPCR